MEKGLLKVVRSARCGVRQLCRVSLSVYSAILQGRRTITPPGSSGASRNGKGKGCARDRQVSVFHSALRTPHSGLFPYPPTPFRGRKGEWSTSLFLLIRRLSTPRLSTLDSFP